MYRQLVIALISTIFFVLCDVANAQDDIRELSPFKRFADGYENSEGGQSLPALVRFGKRESLDPYTKRGPLPALVRFGKRASMPALVRFGKRATKIPAIVRFGKRSNLLAEEPEEEKQVQERSTNDDSMNWILKLR